MQDIIKNIFNKFCMFVSSNFLATFLHYFESEIEKSFDFNEYDKDR